MHPCGEYEKRKEERGKGKESAQRDKPLDGSRAKPLVFF